MDRFRDLDTARSQIDAELTTLLEKVRAHRTKRNMVSPISVVPPEILSEIFIATSLMHDSAAAVRQRMCIWVTHVCQQWREVAIACPRLWSKIEGMAPHMTLVWLERSKGASLDISLDDGHRWAKHNGSLLDLVLPHIGRARSLTLRVNVRCMEQTQPHLRRTAPLLELLHIDMPRTYAFPGMRSWSKDLSDVFSGQHPRLRVVHLQRCHIEWTSSVLSGLTELALYELNTTSRLTVQQVLDIFGRCPHLKRVVLDGAFETAEADVSSVNSVSTMCLQFLNSLELQATKAIVFALMHHVRFPSTVSLNLMPFDDLDDDGFYALLAELEFIERDGFGVPAFAKFEMEMQRASFEAMLFTNSANSLESCRNSPFPPANASDQFVRIHSRHVDVHIDVNARLTALVKTFGLAKIHRLRAGPLFSGTELTSNSLALVLRTCPHIEYMDVSGQTASHLVSALSAPKSKHRKGKKTKDAQMPQALSELRFLIIRNFEFFEHDILERMKGWFERRRAQGSPLELLSILECSHIRKEDIAALNRVVDHVNWDGITGDTEDEEYYSGECTCASSLDDDSDDDPSYVGEDF